MSINYDDMVKMVEERDKRLKRQVIKELEDYSIEYGKKRGERGSKLDMLIDVSELRNIPTQDICSWISNNIKSDPDLYLPALTICNKHLSKEEPKKIKE